MKYYSETFLFYDDIHDILKDISYKTPIADDKKAVLKRLIGRWYEIECPHDACTPVLCPYLKQIDWVLYHGYKNMHELITCLDVNKEINQIPDRKSIEPLKAKWARRPGHFGP